MKKKVSLLLALVMAGSILAGCKDGGKVSTGKNEENYKINFADYKDSEDIPDWTGNRIKVKVWQDANSPNAYERFKKSADDVVTPEYERITGVTYDYNESFDNSGNSFDAKIAQIIASGDYPGMVYRLPELSELVAAEQLYDLAPYIEQYCPNIMKYFGPETKTYGKIWESQKEKYGGLYALSTKSGANSLRSMVSEGLYDYSEEQLNNVLGAAKTAHGYFWVRDDVLKKLYPNAHTRDELKAIYEKNGKFTEEEIFDVPLETPQDFIDFLYDLKNLNIPDDGKGQVFVMYTHDGSDNWNACTVALPLFGFSGNYFSYYDLKDDEVKFTFKETWFKDILKTYNKLIKDGIASSEALIDTKQIFEEKYNNGRYLVSLSTYAPTNNAGNEYKYRKVYVKYTNGYDKILNNSTQDTGKAISFFKKGISEEDLIQVLRAIDFGCSPAGQKLVMWGPKSAGLYEETADGKLQFTEKGKGLYDEIIGTGEDGPVEKFGLKQGPWPGRPLIETRLFEYFAQYDKVSDWEPAFNAGYVAPIYWPDAEGCDVYSNDYTAAIPEAKRFWQSRNAFEDALTQVFAASSDAQFEERYNNLISLAERNGLTEETRKEFDKAYKENNKEFEDGIKSFLAEN